MAQKLRTSKNIIASQGFLAKNFFGKMMHFDLYFSKYSIHVFFLYKKPSEGPSSKSFLLNHTYVVV